MTAYEIDQSLECRRLLAGACGTLESIAEREVDNLFGDYLRSRISEISAFLKKPLHEQRLASATEGESAVPKGDAHHD